MGGEFTKPFCSGHRVYPHKRNGGSYVRPGLPIPTTCILSGGHPSRPLFSSGEQMVHNVQYSQGGFSVGGGARPNGIKRVSQLIYFKKKYTLGFYTFNIVQHLNICIYIYIYTYI